MYGTVLLLLSQCSMTTKSIRVEPTAHCLDASSWYKNFSQQKPWKKYSQGHQDSVLTSLFDELHLGTTNKYFVEFGFNQPGWEKTTSGPNTMLLHHEFGWNGLLLDGGFDMPKDNLHQEFITAENIVTLFAKYGAPIEPDYVSIDIDSCDLWVFLALTKRYRPRVVTVEYNSNYPLGESKTNICKDSTGVSYRWRGDNLYGASLSALHKAARQQGYTMVFVENQLDVFLVRSDLVCKGSYVNPEFFRNFTGRPVHHAATPEQVDHWTIEYFKREHSQEVPKEVLDDLNSAAGYGHWVIDF